MMVQEAAASAGLSHLAATIAELALPSIRLHAHAASEHRIAVGASKIGGHPDLPIGTPWPRRAFPFKDPALEPETIPFAFVAQINLAEVAAYPAAQVLPPTGMLYFFIDAVQDIGMNDPETGFWHNNPTAWTVLYQPRDEQTALKRARFPSGLDDEGRYRAYAVEMAPEMTLPNCTLMYGREGGALADTAGDYRDKPVLSEAECTAYWHLQANLAGYTYQEDEDEEEYPDLHRMFGYPDLVQNPMELECELESHGLSTSVLVTEQVNAQIAARVANLAPQAAEWRLLLQVDTMSNDENDSEMLWGDAGKLYYWIRQQDLRRRDFSQVWCIVQSG